MEAVSKGGASIGILTSNGIVFACERRVSSPLIDFKSASEKLSLVDDHAVFATSGLHSDANTLIDYAQKAAQSHRQRYNSPIPIEQLVTQLCELLHSYTQYGGYRPFGAGFVVGGWDRVYGYQIYETDPSGNSCGWKAVAIGANASAADGVLKKEYREDLSLEEAVTLAVKALTKALEVKEFDAEKMEFAIVTKHEMAGEDGEMGVCFKMLSENDIKKEFVKLSETGAFIAE